MPRNPENLEAPNPGELKPKPQPNPDTVKALGATAIKGANK